MAEKALSSLKNPPTIMTCTRNGRQIPYLLTFIQPNLTESEIQDIINKSGIDPNKSNNSEFIKSRLGGEDYWLIAIAIDDGERARLITERYARAAERQATAAFSTAIKNSQSGSISDGVYEIKRR